MSTMDLTQGGGSPDLTAAQGTFPFLATCGYDCSGPGVVKCERNPEFDIIAIFEAANARCKALGMKPAVDPGDFPYWRKFTTAAQQLAAAAEVTGFVPGSTGQPKHVQAKLAEDFGGIAPGRGEMAALANVLHYIATGEDLFQGRWVRVEAAGVILARTTAGLHVETYHHENPFRGIGIGYQMHDNHSIDYVGCAAARALS